MDKKTRTVFPECTTYIVSEGNGGNILFKDAVDYANFRHALTQAADRFPMPLLAYCLLPNQVHLVVRPPNARDLGRFMLAVLSCYTRLYRKRYKGRGSLWQRGYQSAPVMDGVHTLLVLDRLYRLPYCRGVAPNHSAWRHCHGSAPYNDLPLHEATARFVSHCMEVMAPIGSMAWILSLYGLKPPREKGRPGRPRKNKPGGLNQKK